MTHAEVILKVRRLYALARSTTEGEALAAMAAADRLIREHRLSEVEIHGPESIAEQIARGELGDAPRAIWQRVLMGFLSRRYQCAVVMQDGRVKAYGTQGDLAILALQYDRLGDIVRHSATRACAGFGRSYIDAYRKGMVGVILERLGAEDRQSAGPATAAIVRLDQRQAAAEAERAKNHPNLTIVRARPQSIRGDAYRHGQHDGRNVHLGESMGPATKGELKA